jgi:hypothetical protein
VGRNGFERSKIKKFRPDPYWTPTDTILTDQDGWVMAGEAGQFFFFLQFQKKTQKILNDAPPRNVIR